MVIKAHEETMSFVESGQEFDCCMDSTVVAENISRTIRDERTHDVANEIKETGQMKKLTEKFNTLESLIP